MNSVKEATMPVIATPPEAATKRKAACLSFMRQAHQVLDQEGSTPSALHALKLKLTKLASKSELFALSDFAMPVAQARFHPLAIEDNDGLALHLLIGLPGKMSKPHSHGIWCISAAIAGRERNVMWRRTDDGSKSGYATIERIGEVLMQPGHGFAMSDHDIHSQEVVGDQASVTLALYGHAFERFPSVTWYHPEFSSVRKMPSRRGLNAA
jgi:predicted metal-dependent enzyme (double-stranded beta helix superfamily)